MASNNVQRVGQIVRHDLSSMPESGVRNLVAWWPLQQEGVDSNARADYSMPSYLFKTGPMAMGWRSTKEETFSDKIILVAGGVTGGRLAMPKYRGSGEGYEEWLKNPQYGMETWLPTSFELMQMAMAIKALCYPVGRRGEEGSTYSHPPFISYLLGTFFVRTGLMQRVNVRWMGPWAMGVEKALPRGGSVVSRRLTPMRAEVDIEIRLTTQKELRDKTIADMGLNHQDNIGTMSPQTTTIIG